MASQRVHWSSEDQRSMHMGVENLGAKAKILEYESHHTKFNSYLGSKDKGLVFQSKRNTGKLISRVTLLFS
jgi:hypothetical protein